MNKSIRHIVVLIGLTVLVAIMAIRDNDQVTINPLVQYTQEEEVLLTAESGDLIVAHTADYMTSCKLTFIKRLSPIEFLASFSDGKCVYTDNGGRVSHKSIFKLTGNDGTVIVIPEEHVPAARRAMLSMGESFQ